MITKTMLQQAKLSIIELEFEMESIQKYMWLFENKNYVRTTVFFCIVY